MVKVIMLLIVALVFAPSATAHFKPGRHNAEHAINKAWCGSNNRICVHGEEAKVVARCEASDYYWWFLNRPTSARNGQFLGMFQMGSSERARYGHGSDPWSQARAAHRYWLVSGWGPWQCTPWGYLRW